MNRITVIGFGIMGRGIASFFALNGFDVDIIHKGSSDFSDNKNKLKTEFRSHFRRYDTREEKDDVFSRINTLDVFEDLDKSDFIIECIVEDEDAKADILETVSKLAAKSAIIASNTSSIPITRLSASCRHPERFLGVHFMNPAPSIGLVELIAGQKTDPSLVDDLFATLDGLGKTPIITSDTPGFVLNRILIPYINEGIFCLNDKVAGIQAIDTAMKQGANHPMGPLELADLIGLDTCLSILEQLHIGLNNERYAPSDLLREYVKLNMLGRKTGIGFYDYGSRPKTENFVN